jgi:hypothetical protein
MVITLAALSGIHNIPDNEAAGTGSRLGSPERHLDRPGLLF